MKLTDILILEYSDKTIQTTIDRWKKTSPQIDDNLARQVIQRFDQIKSGLSSKLQQVALSDELKTGQNYLNIDKYSWADMVNLLRSLPEKEDKIKKDAIQMFVEKERMDKGDVTSYVIRFMNNRRNLKYALANGTEDGNYSKEEVQKLVPKRLIPNDAYLDPRAWDFGQMEHMLDALFPMQAKVGEEGDQNTATTDADKVYDKDGIEIYKGDAQHKCIAYNPSEGGRKKYGWCIAQPSNTMYDRYRFMEGTNRMFYFVFDRSLPDTDPYHAFVIHVGEGNKKYWITDAKNSGDKEFHPWEKLKTTAPPVWPKIGHLEHIFKYVDPSKAEISGAAMRGKRLSANDFRELDYEDKQNYVQANAGSLSPEILKILDKELKNLAINYGQKFPYADLKDNEGLAKRYAAFRFRHTNYSKDPIPLPYVKFLDDEAKQKYLETFDDNLTFEYIEKFFGPKATENYVQKQLKNLDYLPPQAIKYIKDPKQKQIFEIYSKLFTPWEFGKDTNIGDEELSTSADMPVQDINPKPITAKEWNQLSPEERKVITNLAEKVNGKEQYSTLLYALPYIIEDKGRKLVLLPLKGEDYSYEDWVLVDENNKVVQKGIDGNTSSVAGTPLISGYPDFSSDPRRVYPSSELEINSGKSDIKEIKINKPFYLQKGNIYDIYEYDGDYGKYDYIFDGEDQGDYIFYHKNDEDVHIFIPKDDLNNYKISKSINQIKEIKVNNPNPLKQLMKDKGVDQKWFDKYIIRMDELTPEELQDLEYVSDRIDTHLDNQDDEEDFEEQFLRERLMHRAGLL